MSESGKSSSVWRCEIINVTREKDKLEFSIMSRESELCQREGIKSLVYNHSINLCPRGLDWKLKKLAKCCRSSEEALLRATVYALNLYSGTVVWTELTGF